MTHEYGHSIQDAQDRGFGTSLGAASLGEGFGDFVSAVNTSITPHLPNYPAAEYCIFDWDGISGYGGPGVAPCGRTADGSDGVSTLSQANAKCGNDPHCYGEVWAHGLIDLMRSLPKDSDHRPPIVVDVLFSQFAYEDNENFNGGLDLAARRRRRAVRQRHRRQPGPHDAAICNEMVPSRGIVSSACRSGPPEKIDPPVSGRGNTGGSLGSDWPTFTRRGGVGGVPGGWVVSSAAESYRRSVNGF